MQIKNLESLSNVSRIQKASRITECLHKAMEEKVSHILKQRRFLYSSSLSHQVQQLVFSWKKSKQKKTKLLSHILDAHPKLLHSPADEKVCMINYTEEKLEFITAKARL